MIALHPQPCPGRPDRVRWVVPPATVPFVGPAAAVPGALGALLADGTLAAVDLEADAVVTGLGPGRSWPADGARVRTAVHAAVASLHGWVPATGDPTGDPAGGDPAGGDDVRLRAEVERLLAGRTGDLARSHGGTIELLDVRDGVVQVRLGGACDGCPAASQTLRVRLAAELRSACPGLRDVVAVPHPAGRRPGLLRLLH